MDFCSGSLDSRITFTGTNGTYFNSAGVLQAATTNQARFDHDPVTLAPKGLLVEESRQNLLLNSLLNGTNLSTQSVTVTAVAHTLSFYGTGTVTLSGVSTAGPLVGTGASDEVSLTFTPTAGSLTLTVSGTVKWANLEIGSFASSFIPTAGAPVTRTADVAVMTGTNFSSWYNATEGTFVVEALKNSSGASDIFFSVNDSTLNNRLTAFGTATRVLANRYATGGVQTNAADTANAYTLNSVFKAATVYSSAGSASCLNGGTVVSGLAASPPTVNRMEIGAQISAGLLNGHIRRITYYNTRLTNAQLQALTL